MMKQSKHVDWSYKELRPAGIYDVAALETWLEDRAKEGYRLVGFRGLNGLFVWDRHQECRYRMEPLHRKEKAPDPERLEVYRELGWEYVTTLPSFYHIWRSDDPTVAELNTDPVVQGESFGYLRRQMVLSTVISCLCFLAVVGISLWIGSANIDTPLLQVLERDLPYRSVLLAALLVLAVALEIRDIRMMRQLLRSLQTGISLDRPRPWRSQKKWAYVRTWLFLAAYLLGGGFSVFAGNSSPAFSWNGLGADGNPRANMVYVDMQVLEDVSPEDLGYFQAKTKSNELASQMNWVNQYADLSDGTGGYAQTVYFHLRTDKLMPTLRQDLLYRAYAPRGLEPIQLENQGLDGFWWAEDVEQYEEPEGTGEYVVHRWQMVVAVRGSGAVMVYYLGNADLRMQGDYLAELLES
jgi:hypothetical protein